jgi:signal transduction histidine kinase
MNSGYLLVVDDIDSNRDVLAMGLTIAGYNVKTADSGLTALSIAREKAPDLILLDVMMPILDGYDTCLAFKAHEELRDVPVIFVSALYESVDKVTGFNAGGVDFLSKPIEMKEVLARVNAHLTLYRQRKEIECLLEERTAAEKAEREARMMVNALLDSLSALTNTLNVNEVLERVISNVGMVVAYDCAFFFRCIDDRGYVTHLQGLEPHSLDALLGGVPLDSIELWNEMREARQPVIIGDVAFDPRWLQIPELEQFHGFIGCPIFVDDVLLGTINLLSRTPCFYDHSAATYLQAFALNAALALRNARLYEQSQELAVLQERQRLARELHDSVTQTLFAANTIAEALPQLVEKKPLRAIEYTHELVRLTRGATAEMRTLLFELRPEAIVKTHLTILLQQVATACAGKTDAIVTVTCDEYVTLPPETHLACYRVAQEALNNIARHSEATRVTLALHQTDEEFELTISDNGKGFNPEHVGANHMGLGFMRERAAAIRADLTITSSSHEGTRISLRGSSL